MTYITLFISAVFINNIVLTRFLGVCPFIGVSKKRNQALAMGITVTIVVLFSSIITYGMYLFILQPLNLEYLRIIAFILVIASLVQFSEIIIKSFFPKIYDDFGVFLPLITTNCLVLGVALTNLTLSSGIENFTFFHVVIHSLGVSAGYTLVIFIFSAIRESLTKAPVSKHFSNVPISLIVAAIMAMAFSGFAGILS